jgi:hypothetical protein
MIQNLNANTDAWADGYRFRLELFGCRGMRMSAPEFARTKAEASRRRKELLETGGVRATIFALTEDGGLRFA